MHQYPHLRLTILLAAVLLPPFALTTLYPKLEPYPAIILPSGSGKVDIQDGQSQFSRRSIWGKRDGEADWHRIPSQAFLDPIPSQYFQTLARNNFGLTPTDEGIGRPETVARVETMRNRAAQTLNAKISNANFSEVVDTTQARRPRSGPQTSAVNLAAVGLSERRFIPQPDGYPVSRQPTRHDDAHELQETQVWLRQRLDQMGYQPDVLRVTSERIRLDVETGVIIKSEKDSEAIFRLD